MRSRANDLGLFGPVSFQRRDAALYVWAAGACAAGAYVPTAIYDLLSDRDQETLDDLERDKLDAVVCRAIDIADRIHAEEGGGGPDPITPTITTPARRRNYICEMRWETSVSVWLRTDGPEWMVGLDGVHTTRAQAMYYAMMRVQEGAI